MLSQATKSHSFPRKTTVMKHNIHGPSQEDEDQTKVRQNGTVTITDIQTKKNYNRSTVSRKKNTRWLTLVLHAHKLNLNSFKPNSSTSTFWAGPFQRVSG